MPISKLETRLIDWVQSHFLAVLFAVVPAMPCILMGRSPLEIVGIYFDQTTLYPTLYLNSPSAWALFLPVVPEFYKSMMAMVLLALAGLVLWAAIFIR